MREFIFSALPSGLKEKKQQQLNNYTEQTKKMPRFFTDLFNKKNEYVDA